MFRSAPLWIVIGLFCLILTGCQQPNSDRYVVVMISVDGLAASYLDDPAADMPTLRALAGQGARAESMKASTPTLTWPNHATLVTGDQPARHGVVGNNIYDRASGKKVVLISDPEWEAGRILKVPTVYDAAKAAGLTTAAVRWPVTRGSKTLDLLLPDMSDDTILKSCSTPSLIERGLKAGIFDRTDFVPADPEKHPQVKDEAATRLFDMVLHQDHPRLALLHLIEVDHDQHEAGPQSPQAYAAIRAADTWVKRVWDTLRRDYPGRATLVVVSDHGFSPIHSEIRPNVILRDAGLIKVVGARVVAGDVENLTGGGADLIYVKDPARRDEVVAKVKAAFASVPGVRKILTPPDYAAYGVADPAVDPHAPDVLLLADYGYSFGNTSNGAISVTDKPERKGSHGQDADLPQLHATFVAWGVGVKAGARLGEISNVDVAPTIAKLLGVPLPNTDGKPLDAILAP